MSTTLKTLMFAGVFAISAASFGQAQPQNNDTPADTIHPDIHDKVGQGAGNNANANPNGANANGGQVHGIGNNPGQSGADPSDGAPGFADQLETVHGGIGAYNPNAN